MGGYRSGCFVRSFGFGKVYYAAPPERPDRWPLAHDVLLESVALSPSRGWFCQSKCIHFENQEKYFFCLLILSINESNKKISTSFCLCAPACLFEDAELRSLFVEYLWTKFSGTRGLFSTRRSLFHLYVISFSIVIVLVETIEPLWVKLPLMQWIRHYTSSSLLISFRISHSVLLTTVLGVFHHQIDS